MYSDHNFSIFFLLYISIFIITIFSLFICIFLLLLLLFLYPFVYFWFFADTIGNISAFFSFKFECFIALGVFFFLVIFVSTISLMHFSLSFLFSSALEYFIQFISLVLMIFPSFLKHFCSKYLYVSLLPGSFSL